jgi:thioredoxin 1
MNAATASATEPLHLTADSFAAALATSQERPVLVDFWAPWCGPCKAQAPILDQVASAHGGRVLVAKLDVDEFPEIAAAHEIRSLPTLVVFRHGRETARLVGLQSAAAINAALGAVA